MYEFLVIEIIMCLFLKFSLGFGGGESYYCKMRLFVVDVVEFKLFVVYWIGV